MDQERIYKEMHELEGIIGYTFNNIQHLADAMNATKLKNDNAGRNNDEHYNHALATVGDALLKSIIAEYFFQNGNNRGEISTKKSQLENNDKLFQIANDTRIVDYAYHETHFLKDNPPQNQKVSNSKHNQYIEAIIAAILHDSNYEELSRWVYSWLLPRVLSEVKTMDENVDFINYLKHLIALNNINRKLGGKSIVTPVMFSEKLCRKILNLGDRERGSKDHDAKEEDLKIEIKATSSCKGTTTYNPKNKVDKYIWMFLDYEKKKIIFKETKELKKINVSKDDIECEEVVVVSDDVKNRESITLSQYDWKVLKTISMDTLEEI